MEMSSRRQEGNNAASDGDLESADSYGTDHEKDSSSNAGAEASGSGDPADSSDKGDEGVGGSDANAEASGSGSKRECAESEELPSIPNKLPDSDIPAIAIRKLFNSRLKDLKREMESILQEFNQDKYAEIERRQAERKGSRAQKRNRRQQRKYPRVPAQAYLVLLAPDGRIHCSMSEEMEEHPQVKRATELLTASLGRWVEGQGPR